MLDLLIWFAQWLSVLPWTIWFKIGVDFDMHFDININLTIHFGISNLDDLFQSKHNLQLINNVGLHF